MSALLGVALVGNSLVMLIQPLWWYGIVPGVSATGPFNPHFIRDIAVAYISVAGGLSWFAWRPVQGLPALVLATSFLILHGLIHVYDALLAPMCGHSLLRDLPSVFSPALIASALAWAGRPT